MATRRKAARPSVFAHPVYELLQKLDAEFYQRAWSAVFKYLPRNSGADQEAIFKKIGLWWMNSAEREGIRHGPNGLNVDLEHARKMSIKAIERYRRDWENILARIEEAERGFLDPPLQEFANERRRILNNLPSPDRWARKESPRDFKLLAIDLRNSLRAMGSENPTELTRLLLIQIGAMAPKGTKYAEIGFRAPHPSNFHSALAEWEKLKKK